MNPIDHAWKILKGSHRMSEEGDADEDELDPIEFGDYGLTDEDSEDEDISRKQIRLMHEYGIDPDDPNAEDDLYYMMNEHRLNIEREDEVDRGEDSFDEYWKKLQDKDFYISDKDDDEPSEIKPKPKHPIDTDPFTMQKPQMKDILTQISEELARRGGFTEKPFPFASDKNNPFIRNKRKEMLDLQQRIEDEQARRAAKRGRGR